MGKAKKRISIAILVIVVLLALFASLIGFISDFLWFKAACNSVDGGHTDADNNHRSGISLSD